MNGASLLLMLMLPVPAPQVPDSIVHREGIVVDAVQGAPVNAAVVRTTHATSRTGADGRFLVALRDGDTVRVTRIGYREWSSAAADLPAGALVVSLVRVAVPLAAVDVSASGDRGDTFTRAAADLRTEGATTAAQAAAALPFVSARTTSSRTAFSVRGSRAEQVMVTLDGVPLNDPATGMADPSDLPLVAIGSATVVPGSDASRHGSGASGGVIAFNSAPTALIALTAGSYGARAAEVAWPVRLGSVTVRTGGAWSTAANSFAFRNTAAGPPADTVEQRANADVTRRALFASVLAPRVQLLAVASDTERGLAGAMNVRAFDQARGRTRRGLARVLTTGRGLELSAGARTLSTEYRDPLRAFTDSEVDAFSTDAEVAGSVWSLALRGGGGVDRVSGTGIAARSRPRLFASAAREVAGSRLRAAAAARVDHVRDAGTHVSPSVTIGTQGPIAVSVRAARAFRVPTFFDLYLSSPQRVFARELRPERVTSDLELRADVSRMVLALTRITAGASVFERRTTDAIVWFPGNVGWSPHNVPAERVRGAEAHVAVEQAGWSADAWAAAYDARLWDGYLETRTPYVPYIAGSTSAGWRHGGTTLRGGVRFVGRRPFVNGPALRELELPAAATVRLSLAHVLAVGSTSLTVHAGVNDLTGARPEEVRRHPAPGRSIFAGLALQPGSSR